MLSVSSIESELKLRVKIMGFCPQSDSRTGWVPVKACALRMPVVSYTACNHTTAAMYVCVLSTLQRSLTGGTDLWAALRPLWFAEQRLSQPGGPRYPNSACLSPVARGIRDVSGAVPSLPRAGALRPLPSTVRPSTDGAEVEVTDPRRHHPRPTPGRVPPTRQPTQMSRRVQGPRKFRSAVSPDEAIDPP